MEDDRLLLREASFKDFDLTVAVPHRDQGFPRAVGQSFKRYTMRGRGDQEASNEHIISNAQREYGMPQELNIWE